MNALSTPLQQLWGLSPSHHLHTPWHAGIPWQDMGRSMEKCKKGTTKRCATPGSPHSTGHRNKYHALSGWMSKAICRYALRMSFYSGLASQTWSNMIKPYQSNPSAESQWVWLGTCNVLCSCRRLHPKCFVEVPCLFDLSVFSFDHFLNEICKFDAAQPELNQTWATHLLDHVVRFWGTSLMPQVWKIIQLSPPAPGGSLTSGVSTWLEHRLAATVGRESLEEGAKTYKTDELLVFASEWDLIKSAFRNIPLGSNPYNAMPF